MPRAASTLPVRPRWPAFCLLLLVGLAASGGCAQSALFGNRQHLPTGTFTLPAPEPLENGTPRTTQTATTQTGTARAPAVSPPRNATPRSATESIVPASHQQPAQPTTANPRAIRVARLLQALVQEDRQPGGSELARRQRLATSQTLGAEASSPTDSANTTPAGAPGAPGAASDSLPDVTTTPLAMELSQLVDGAVSPNSSPAVSPPTAPPRTPAATLPGSQVAELSLPASGAVHTPGEQAALQARLRQLTAQLQAAELQAAQATRNTPAAASPGSATAPPMPPQPHNIQQTGWNLPAGSTTANQQATLALLMLRIEQIAARLEQMQSQNQPAPTAPPKSTAAAPAASAESGPSSD